MQMNVMFKIVWLPIGCQPSVLKIALKVIPLISAYVVDIICSMDIVIDINYSNIYFHYGHQSWCEQALLTICLFLLMLKVSCELNVLFQCSQKQLLKVIAPYSTVRI